MPSNDDARAICEKEDLGERHISFFGVEVKDSGDKIVAEKPFILPGGDATFDGLKEGEYSVTVTAYVTFKDETGNQTDTPVYKGSDTKFVAAGSEPTKFTIKLKKIPAEDNSDDNDSFDCPFYADPIEDTKFHTVLTLGNMENITNAFETPLKDGQYYQLVTTNSEKDSLVLGTINLVTSNGQNEPQIEPLIKNLYVCFANYFYILLVGDDDKPYLILTKYAEDFSKNDDFFVYSLVEYFANSFINEDFSDNYFDFLYPYNAIQIYQYMPQAYKKLWDNKKDLSKYDEALEIDRPYYLGELNEEELKEIGVARITFNVISQGLEETFYTTYAMGGNSVSIPNADYFNVLSNTVAIYSDKDAKNKVTGSINVSAGINNLYIVDKEDIVDKKDDGSSKVNFDVGITDGVVVFSYDSDSKKNISTNFDFSIQFQDDNEIKENDTVVLTLSGTPTKDITGLQYQIVYQKTNGDYENYDFKYNNTLPNITLKAEEYFTIDLPINFVSNPDNYKIIAIQLFYGGDINNTANIVNAKASITVYRYDEKNSKGTIEFFKSYDIGTKKYRDECLLKDVPELSERALKKGDELSVRIKTKSNQDATFYINVVDESDGYNLLNTENYGSYKVSLIKGDNGYTTVTIPLVQDGNGENKNRLQFIRELEGNDPKFDEPLILEDFSISVTLN